MQTETLKTILSQYNLSLTRPRLLVFEKLHQNKPLSISELVQACTPLINPSSVYRTVEVFERIGVVHRVWIGFKSKVELSGNFNDHHHHLTCVSCGTIEEFRDDELESQLKQVASKRGAKITGHDIEMTVLCVACNK